MWPGGRISRVVDGLGAVAVGVEQEAAVVVVAVLGPRPRRAVVAVARLRAGAPERLDVLARARAEGDVQPARDRVRGVGRREREVVPLGEARVAVGGLDAQRLEHRVVEGLRRGAVGDPDGHVVEHSEQLAQRGVLAHVLLDLGLARDARRASARARRRPRRPRASSTRASATRRPGLSGCFSRPSSTIARACGRIALGQRDGAEHPLPRRRLEGRRPAEAQHRGARLLRPPRGGAWPGRARRRRSRPARRSVSPSSVNVARPRATK